MKYKTLVIDCMNIAYRVHFKMPHLTSQSGDATNIIFGFLIQINALYGKFKPDYVYLTWDSRQNKRKKIDKTYKLNRNKDKDDLKLFHKQVDIIKKAMPKIGLQSLEWNGHEADDIMAVIASHDKLKPIVIATGDDDMYQLLEKNQNVVVFTKKTTSADGELVTAENFREKFGFPVNMYVLWKGIVGCGSDKVKGIRGWGEKKFDDLYDEYGNDIDSIIERIIEEGKDEEFDNSLRLVELPLDNGKFHITIKKPKINKKELVNFCHKYNIRKITPSNFFIKDKNK